MQSIMYMRCLSFFLFFLFFFFLHRLCKFVLPLTLKERHHRVVYDAVIELALMLIDGAVLHRLKAACIYTLPRCTWANSDCFLPPVLGKMPGMQKEGKKYHRNA